jgi:hypothetical protein
VLGDSNRGTDHAAAATSLRKPTMSLLLSEEEIFAAAVVKAPAERAAFLERACSGDAYLRAQVEALRS